MYNKENDDFYLVLPSNASMDIFPSNTLTNYITQLPHQITLNGRCAVALVEIQIPYKFLHIHPEENIYCYSVNKNASRESIKKHLTYYQNTLDSKDEYEVVEHEGDEIALGDEKDTHELVERTYGKNLKCRIRSGMYANEYELLTMIEETLNSSFNAIAEATDLDAEKIRHVELRLVNSFLQVSLLCYCNDSHYIEFSKQMIHILGIDNQPLLLNEDEYIAPRTCSLRKCAPEQLFVYSDIIEPHVVGDSLTPLLRVVSAENAELNTNIVKTYNTLQYFPLLSFRLDTLLVRYIVRKFMRKDV